MALRKFVQPGLPTLSFRDGILSVPGYTFEKSKPWNDTGSMTLLAEGSSLKDGSSVLAKIAPAQSNASVCLEREAHILGRVSTSSDAVSTALRLIELLNVPPGRGDCIVLLLVHPGMNILGRYLPPSRVNDLLLPEETRPKPLSSYGDVYMMGIEEADMEEMDLIDVMDLASFLEFAIQAAHCLETMHKCGVFHREVRANAFHWNSHSGLVRFVHFGNRAVSLEKFGSPSQLVIQAEDIDKFKVKEALCYLAPEQTGSIETFSQDHRTDIYGLGILFWTLLVGRGQMPFEGGPLELLHSIVQTRPMPVHEARRDVPQVLASIIDKMLSKNPDSRYQSAYGLNADLRECQTRLLVTVSSISEQSSELIPPFEIAKNDRFMEFTMPIGLFGREKELELISKVISETSTSFSRQFSTKGYPTISSTTIQASDIGTSTADDLLEINESDSVSSWVTEGQMNFFTLSRSPPSQIAVVNGKTCSLYKARNLRSSAVVISGPPGIGKSSMILANQAKWRSHGLWGQAKFQNAESSPFAALFGCLSSVLRQLMAFRSDLRRFVTVLCERLGPQMQNIPLLYDGNPELKDILGLFNIHLDISQEILAAGELRSRFHSLVESVFTVIAETRLFALFLDDLHEADESTLDLVDTLVNSRSKMLIFATLRSDKPEIVTRVRNMFNTRTKPTWINVEPLSYSAISALVSKTLHRSREDCAPLSSLIYARSSGNAFAARNLLTAFQRQRHIAFDWEHNYWVYNMPEIKESQKSTAIPGEQLFLINRFRELPEEARKYLLWAGFFGATFKVAEIALMMDWENSMGVFGSDDEMDERWNLPKAVSHIKKNKATPTRSSMRGLQYSVTEGWLIQRARDMCSFAHDRYRQAVQAELENLSEDVIAKMSFRIILMLLHDESTDVYRIAEHAKRCLPLLLDHPKREVLLGVLADAGESAWARGAHESAIQSFKSARTLLRDRPWDEDPERTLLIFSRIAALSTWKGDLAESDVLVAECLSKVNKIEDKAVVLRMRSRNHLMRGEFKESHEDLLLALHGLGVDLPSSPSKRQLDNMFEKVKSEILAVGVDNFLSISKSRDSKVDLAVALLNDAASTASWNEEGFIDVVGLTIIQLALRSGISSGTALGFFWMLGAAARKEQYRFSVDVGKLGLQIAEQYGSSMEKCRARVLFCALVSGFDSVHVRANIPRLEQAMKYGNSAGDRVYKCFATVTSMSTRLFVCEHLTELVPMAEEYVNDIRIMSPSPDPVILAMAILNCIRAIGGHTHSQNRATVFDTDSFIEAEYTNQIHVTAKNLPVVMNIYNSYKIVALYCLGYAAEAAELGFSVYTTRAKYSNQRNIRYALFFHSLAMIDRLRLNLVGEDEVRSYHSQIALNQAFIRKWLSPSAINVSTWVALVDAELSSLRNGSESFKLYDVAVKLAMNNDWLMEEGWALFLQGSHFVRCGVEGLGSELQRRGIARHTQWGAQGIVNFLTSIVGVRSQFPVKRHIFSADATVQTDSAIVELSPKINLIYNKAKTDTKEDREIATLSASDLASILKWSKDISSDINLSSALQRLTEIVTETSGSQKSCIVIAGGAGDYTVATSMIPPGSCRVHENPTPVRAIEDPLQRAIIQYALNIKERVFFEDVSLDSRFLAEAGQSSYRSVVCLPIFSNRGQTFGAVYFSSKYTFSRNTVTILTLLCQQASISIANALLFRSVQTGTRENLKMISAQRDALEAARKSREDALKATKIKSNFLASMSHELRTPFSSFYGLLDLLSGTELDAGQTEIVQTAKQSCELLLKIIDSILDYSKLEASAVKLEYSEFLVENIIADCMELLLPMAAKKLDLSFNIMPNVPAWVTADYARIRQVLMNLIGNAVKFTAKGYVRVICSLDETSPSSSKEIHLKFVIQDTGIGLSSSDVELLFVPFQQADNSSTRRFGGTGLGLSISRQLVKLMGGAIGVQSELGIGSMFYFTLPVKIFNSEETQKATKEIESLRSSLLVPRPLHIITYSSSDATLALLDSMLTGFEVASFSEIEQAKDYLLRAEPLFPALDFFILDDQLESHADELAQFLESLRLPMLKDTKIIHFYTPTIDNLSGHTVFSSNTPGVVKMTKPPRKARLLQLLAGLKNLPNTLTTDQTTKVARAVEDLAAAQRTLYGNVLVAEDNPIAQKLLVKQLNRYQLNVTTTNNGLEAIAEWEAHEPGYFSVALFDHHMPVCDGVEASKRLRELESKRKCSTMLPIVALSADCQESTKQLCLSAGMNVFFSKPLKKSDLMSLLSMFGTSPSGMSV